MFEWNEILTKVGLVALGAIGAVLTQLATKVAEPIIYRIADFFRVPREMFKIQIGARYEELATCAKFKFMLVRYGVDDMLVHLPAKQRTEAQLQTRIFPVDLGKGSTPDTAMLIFRLPVHPVLGTQFKLFAVPKIPGDIEALNERLNSANEIVLTSPSPGGEEAWFLFRQEKVPRFYTVKTIPSGIENNYVKKSLSKAAFD
jgi:hypothetical protein